jgi:hypothetical protein
MYDMYFVYRLVVYQLDRSNYVQLVADISHGRQNANTFNMICVSLWIDFYITRLTVQISYRYHVFTVRNMMKEYLNLAGTGTHVNDFHVIYHIIKSPF